MVIDYRVCVCMLYVCVCVSVSVCLSVTKLHVTVMCTNFTSKLGHSKAETVVFQLPIDHDF